MVASVAAAVAAVRQLIGPRRVAAAVAPRLTTAITLAHASAQTHAQARARAPACAAQGPPLAWGKMVDHLFFITDRS